MTNPVQIGRFIAELLTDRAFLLAVDVTEPPDVRDLIRQAVLIGGQIEGKFDPDMDEAVITVKWPKLKIVVIIRVPDVGFDPDVALARLGVPNAEAEQTH